MEINWCTGVVKKGKYFTRSYIEKERKRRFCILVKEMEKETMRAGGKVLTANKKTV